MNSETYQMTDLDFMEYVFELRSSIVETFDIEILEGFQEQIQDKLNSMAFFISNLRINLSHPLTEWGL